MKGSYMLPLLAASMSSWGLNMMPGSVNSTFPPMSYSLGPTRIGFHRRHKRIAKRRIQNKMGKASRRINRK